MRSSQQILQESGWLDEHEYTVAAEDSIEPLRYGVIYGHYIIMTS